MNPSAPCAPVRRLRGLAERGDAQRGSRATAVGDADRPVGPALGAAQPRVARSCSKRSGTTRHHIQRPRFSPTMSPASTRALV